MYFVIKAHESTEINTRQYNGMQKETAVSYLWALELDISVLSVLLNTRCETYTIRCKATKKGVTENWTDSVKKKQVMVGFLSHSATGEEED